MNGVTVLRWVPILLLLTLPARAQKISVEFDETRDFAGYKTFALLNGKINSKNPSLNNDLVTRKLETIIRQRLTERGLTEAESKADLNLVYSLGSGKRREVERYGAGWRGSRRRVVQYTEGTLVLSLRDTSRHELVWQAVAIEDKSDPSKIQGALDDMVRKSFEKYPPKKK